MKKLFIPLLLSLSFSTFADSCFERVKDANWTEDKINYIVSCHKLSTTNEIFSAERACFAIMKTQASQYNVTNHSSFFFNEDEPYVRNIALVSVGTNGYKSHGKISKNQKGETTYEYKRLTTGNTLTTTLNLDDPKNLSLVVEEAKFFSKKIIEKTEYNCERIL